LPSLGLHKSIGAKFGVIRDLHGPNTQARASSKVSALLSFLFFFSNLEHTNYVKRKKQRAAGDDRVQQEAIDSAHEVE
jgi:hypothetical protein